MAQNDISDDWEGFKLFTPDDLDSLRERQKRLEENKYSEKYSGAKQSILKGLNESWTPSDLDQDEFVPEPDPTLEDGQELPQYYGAFPDELYNCLLEDVDVYYKQRGLETFCMVSKRYGKNYIYRFSATNSFFIFPPFLRLRHWALNTILHPAFDAFVMIIILVNCVFLGLNEEYLEAEYTFTVLYTIEMLIKMMARGFILNRFSYLRDPWNWLDFFVVVLAYATIAGTTNVSALRTFRVFRAFKSVSIVPGLRTIVNSLFRSMKPLAEVMLIMLFLVVVVALIGLQAYQGVLRRRCVKNPHLQEIDSHAAWARYVENRSNSNTMKKRTLQQWQVLPWQTSRRPRNRTCALCYKDTKMTAQLSGGNWNDVEGETVVCGNDTGSGICPSGFLCLPGVDDNPNHGYTNFDHMGYSLLTSFQLITLDYWENVYNMIIRAEGPWSVLFFLMSVFLGPFYLLNLLLAVVTLAYSKEHEKQKEMEQMRLKTKERTKRKHQRKKKLEEQRLKEIAHSNTGTSGPALLNVVSRMSFQPHSFSGQSELSVEKESHFVEDVIGAVSDNYRDNGDAGSEPGLYRLERQSNSLESSVSSKSDLSGWNFRWRRFSRWFNDTFCCWNCPAWFLWLQRRLQSIIRHKLFETVIILCIIMNTIFLAIDYHGITVELDKALETGNQIFTAIFIVEAVLKLFAMGPVTYASDRWNDFDFAIVFISIIELILGSTKGSTGRNGLTVLRTLRLLRVFRLAKMWGTMHKLMAIIWKSMSAVGYLTFVLFLVLYIFAVIGKQLYGKKYTMDCRNRTDSGDCGPNLDNPRWNFDDFYHSFLLVWRVMCGEWIELLHECLCYTCGHGLCIPFFLIIMFIANFMILNLFTAILLEAFNVDSLQGKEDTKSRSSAFLKKVEAFKKKLNRASRVDSEPENITKNIEDQTTPDAGTDIFHQEVGIFQTTSQKRISLAPSNMFELTEVSTIGLTHVGDVSPGSRIETQLGKSTNSLLQIQTSLEKIPVIGEKVEDDVRNNAANETSKNHKDSNGNTAKKVSFSERKNSGCLKQCCCYVGGRTMTESNSSVNQSFTSAPTNQDNNAIVEVTCDGKNEKEETEPPDCLPKWLQISYPGLSTISTCKLYKYWRLIRKACFKLVEHQIFEGFILFLILSSTICLAMEDAYLDSDPVKKDVLAKLEYVFTGLFTLEMLLKWIGFGPTRYFTSVWCLLDCAIVGVSWTGIILNATRHNANTGAFRSLRTLRALRPLRAISRWQGMKVVVNALIYCIPSIGNVLCVCLLIWFVFGIIGVQFFKGRFASCRDANGELVADNMTTNKSECFNHDEYEWVYSSINFDNVLNAMVALFQVATFEGWIEVMADASDVKGLDMQPERDSSQYYLIFFVIFILVGSFFILNLIVGVIIESFQKLRKQTDSASAVETLLTESQKKFYKTMRTMLNRKPKKSIQAPKNKFQLTVFNIVTHNHFELAVFFLIALNMLALSMEHYNMSKEWRDALRNADTVFTSLFTLEAIFKLIGMRLYYFRDAFNVFDFIVIIISITTSVLDSIKTLLLVSPTLLRVVRVFRVFRVLRLIRAARGIRRLVLTLVISLPALFNIAVLLGVFLVIFAILGMNSFMYVKLNGALNDQVNFKTFGNSMLLLFRLVTSAGWNDVLEPLMNTRNCTDTSPEIVGDCGNPIVAVLYFISFIFIVFLVIVNMYIAIILENFDEIFQQDESGVSQGDFETFYMVWGRYDPRATQFVTLSELSSLLHDLHPPFQLPKPNLIKIGALDLPVLYGDKVHCLDVLFALVKRIMGEVEISEDMRKEAEIRLLKSFPNRKTLKAETTTLALRQQARAAKVIQESWKSYSKRRKDSCLTGLYSATTSTFSSPKSPATLPADKSRFGRDGSVDESNKNTQRVTIDVEVSYTKIEKGIDTMHLPNYDEAITDEEEHLDKGQKNNFRPISENPNANNNNNNNRNNNNSNELTYDATEIECLKTDFNVATRKRPLSYEKAMSRASLENLPEPKNYQTSKNRLTNNQNPAAIMITENNQPLIYPVNSGASATLAHSENASTDSAHRPLLDGSKMSMPTSTTSEMLRQRHIGLSQTPTLNKSLKKSKESNKKHAFL